MNNTLIQSSAISLSIIIPCFNEERNLRLGAMEKVLTYLTKSSFTWELIVVDDGSTDGSIKLLRAIISDYKNVKIIKITHEGKAAAVVAGVTKAVGTYVLFTDMDQATPIDQWSTLYPYFLKGYDIVIGSRNRNRRGAPLLRKAMAIGFMSLRNIILNLGIKDTQCGFKAFTGSCAKTIFPKLKVFAKRSETAGSTVTAGFDVELLYIAKTLGFRIKEVPVEWHYQETRHINPIRDSVEGIKDLIEIRLNSIAGVYEAKK